MPVRLMEELGTEYIAPHYSIELSQLLAKYDDIDIAGCRIAKDAMRNIDNGLAAGKNIFDSADADREDLLRQAREKALIDSSIAIELPRLEEMKMFLDYIKSLDIEKEYCVKGDYSKEYLYPLLTLINIYKPAVVIQISDKLFDLALYISRTLYRRGIEELFKSTKEFLIITQECSRVITFNTKDTKECQYVYGYGDISFDTLTSKTVVLPNYFGKEKIAKDPALNELWKDVKEIAIKNLDRYFHVRRETIKSFLGGE